MTDHRTASRKDFDRFVEQLRCETFSMYELLREMQSSADDDMPIAFLDLATVGSKSANIFAEIEALCAAIWLEPADAAGTPLPAMEQRRGMERMLALVR